jgi:hypothetical protein
MFVFARHCALLAQRDPASVVADAIVAAAPACTAGADA